jgi:3-deoxy-D-manno-octulosonic-acid transferase
MPTSPCGWWFRKSWSTTYLNQYFWVPIIIGPNYSHLREATALVNMGGCISVSNKTELIAAFKDLMLIPTIEAKRSYLSTFVQMNKGNALL